LSELRLWTLPFVAALGALTKESFIPLSIVFMAAWWFVVRKKLALPAERNLDYK
jgi:hypothetical protein